MRIGKQGYWRSSLVITYRAITLNFKLRSYHEIKITWKSWDHHFRVMVDDKQWINWKRHYDTP
jgi:hypothetical protein